MGSGVSAAYASASMLDSISHAAGQAGPYGFAAAMAAIVFAGLMRGFTGFGAMLIIVPVLSVVYSPQLAVPIAFMNSVPSALQLLPTAFRQGDRAFILPVAVAAFLFAPIGAWGLVSIAPEVLKIVIAVAVLAMAALMQSGWRPQRPLKTPELAAVGGLCGLIQGLSSMGGPPAVIAALSQDGDIQAQRANVIGATVALSFAAAIPLWRLGLLTAEVFWLALLFVPTHAAAVWLGARFFHHGGQRHYRQAALATLFAVGIGSLAVAIRDYGG